MRCDDDSNTVLKYRPFAVSHRKSSVKMRREMVKLSTRNFQYREKSEQVNGERASSKKTYMVRQVT